MLQNKFRYTWDSKLANFYDFIEASRKFLAKDLRQYSDMNLISRVRNIVEISQESPIGTVYQQSKFDNAIYHDIDNIALFKVFFQKFTLGDIRRFQKLIYLEKKS